MKPLFLAAALAALCVPLRAQPSASSGESPARESRGTLHKPRLRPARTPKAAAPAPKAQKRLPSPSVLKEPSTAKEAPVAIDIGAPDAEETRALAATGDPGLLADEREGGLLVRAVAARSFSERLGLRPGDLLRWLGGRKTSSLEALRSALASVRSGVRASAAVQRAETAEGLSTPAGAPSKPFTRDPQALTPLELRIRADHAEEAGRQIPATLKSFKTPSFRISAGESLWVRFPLGIRRTISEGDVIEGETASPMASDANLDFLAVPPGSRIWAQATSVKDSGREILLRLHVFKIALAGGHIYPCSGILTDVSGDPSLLRISRGGTIVAAPSDGELLLSDPERSYLLRLLEPLTIHEAREFFLAGPGLWFKTSGDPRSRTFEVTRIVDKRSAEQAGIRVGDRLLSVDGKSAEKVSFQNAVARLYGRPGTSVGVRFMHAGETRSESVSLLRGALWRSGLGLTVRRDGASVVVRKVLPGSPAEKAGVKEGDLLLSFGKTDASGMNEEELRARMREDLSGENAPIFLTPERSPRKTPLERAVFPALLEPDILGEGVKTP